MNIELYTGKSLLKLKRIIERKLKAVFKKEDDLPINKASGLMNFNLHYKKIIKKPGEMLKHSDLGLLVQE